MKRAGAEWGKSTSNSHFSLSSAHRIIDFPQRAVISVARMESAA
jgi:hypothetical protein